ncbi:MAG: type I-MYXAN CRISPR-associated Cas8a1/Cmx1 [Pirellula sp.]
MAKIGKNGTNSSEPKSITNNDATSKLELWLHAPGMDVMLRAGLGGLAAVLQQMENTSNEIRDKSALPGWPWKDDSPPWTIDMERIVLDFKEPQLAGEFMKRLFEFAFRIDKKEEVIDLPATYDIQSGQDRLVRAQLQRGLMLTFLQHGQSRKTAKDDEERSIEIDGKPISYSVRPVYSYKHQTGYEDLVDPKKGTILNKAMELPGTLYPGAAVRHNKFNSHTKHEATATELIAAYFALIGTLALPVNRGSAVLLVPHVTDLIHFAANRNCITPGRYQDCLIGGTGDAVLGIYAKRQKEDISFHLKVPAISAYLFQPTAWASQQKSRVAGIRVESLDPVSTRVFSYASTHLRAQLRTRVVKEVAGKKKAKVTKEVEQSFWSTSIVKPLIADNLANHRAWFTGFVGLFTRKDPANGKPLRSRLFFEKEGLAQMVKANVWSDEGQRALVTGVQFALSCQFGKISGEFSRNPQGMKNKFQKEFEKWRIQFASAKTADQFRFSVCNLMSRARGNESIQKNWQQVLPLLTDSGWQHGRDLALLALAAYQGKGDKETAELDNQENESIDS